jgi:hypothetical protein
MKGVRRRVRPARRGCYQHDLVPAATAGWFVCQACGLGAVCPGCVERVPGGIPLYLCEDHQALQAVEVYGPRMAWTVEQGSQRGGK